MHAAVSARSITEERRGDVPLFVHPEWVRDFPWLVQGITEREAGSFASFGNQPAAVVHERWRTLRNALGCHTAVLGRQVHGPTVLTHGALSPGLLFTDDADAHLTRAAGVLLAVSIADCVPVFLIDVQQRTVAVLHAGWRGVAARILTRGLAALRSGNSADVRVHFGPSICGQCYEVGPEVHRALGLTDPGRNTPVDLRAVLLREALELSVAAEHVTTSSFCTRCGESPFFSHRRGDPERQVGVIAVKT